MIGAVQAVALYMLADAPHLVRLFVLSAIALCVLSAALGLLARGEFIALANHVAAAFPWVRKLLGSLPTK